VTASEEELITFMQDNLARYKVPKTVEFLTELPISAAGKILKRELREQFV
jgi:acyl-CoA synthetase (AMP-forming)/AMP-acid ligase II